jgi:hypothetical protein
MVTTKLTGPNILSSNLICSYWNGAYEGIRIYRILRKNRYASEYLAIRGNMKAYGDTQTYALENLLDAENFAKDNTI